MPAAPSRRSIGLVVAWLLAAGLAVTVGVVAVSGLGAAFRDRGPIGDNEAVREAQLGAPAPSPDADADVVRRSLTGEFGAFVVECQGAYARGVRATAASGWRVVSFEPGPDDDVDAIFGRGDRSVEMDVFCNQGRPTVAEIERNRLPED